MSDKQYVIQRETLEGIANIVRKGEGAGDKIPVKELGARLNALVEAGYSSIPVTYELNFQTEVPTIKLRETSNCSLTFDPIRGYGTFTPAASDTWVIFAENENGRFCEAPASKLDYIVMKYRVRHPKGAEIPDTFGGELYVTRSDGPSWTSPFGGAVKFNYEADQEWHHLLINAHNVWGIETDEVYLSNVRFDPLQEFPVNPDTNDKFEDWHLDVAYIKFFAEEHYAKAQIEADSFVKVTEQPDIPSWAVYNYYEQFYTGKDFAFGWSGQTYPSLPEEVNENAYSDLSILADSITVVDKATGNGEFLVESEAGRWLYENECNICGQGDSVSQIEYKGWVNPLKDERILSYGYRLGNDAIVWNNAFVVYDEQLISALGGAQNARRHTIVIPIQDERPERILPISLFVKTIDSNNQEIIYSMGTTWPAHFFVRHGMQGGKNYETYETKTNTLTTYSLYNNKIYREGKVVDALYYGPVGDIYANRDTVKNTFDLSFYPTVYFMYNYTIKVQEKFIGSLAAGIREPDFVLPDIVTKKASAPAIIGEEGANHIVSATLTENGTYLPSEDAIGFGPVTVAVPGPVLSELEVIKNGEYKVPNGIDGYDVVKVNVPIREYVSKSLKVEENGIYTPTEGVDGFSSVEVNIDTMQEEFIQTVDRSITEIKAEDLKDAWTIGYGAFQNCYSLERVELPNSVRALQSLAFSECSLLSDIVISGVTTIGDRAFYNCKKLISVDIPNGAIHIGTYAFQDSGLENIIIPDTVTVVGVGAFANCTNLASASIGSGITSIDTATFSNCTALSVINIPDSITSIELNAFLGCYALTDVYYAGSKEEWLEIAVADGNDPLYSATIHYGKPSEPIGCEGLEYVSNGDGTCYVAGRGTCSHEDVVIPEISPDGDTVTRIADSALKENTYITSVVIPRTVVEIGPNAFNGCMALKTLVLNEGLLTIGRSAFYGTGLMNIEIPISVTSIDIGAFGACPELESIVVKQGNSVYYSNNNNIIEVNTKTIIAGCKTSVIPSDGSVVKIGAWAFIGSSWATLEIPDAITEIGETIFSNSKNLQEVILSKNIVRIPSNAFYGCSALTSITIPDSVIAIGIGAFSGCSALKTITIGVGLGEVGMFAFNASGLTDVYYAASKDEWAKINIASSNSPLLDATKHFAIEKPTLILYANELLTNVNTGLSLDAVVTDNNYITYTYITYTPESNDPYYYPFTNMTGDRYLRFRYRTTTAEGAFIQCYIGSSGGGPQNDDTMLKAQIVSASADGEWHDLIFDLQSLVNAGHYDGKTVAYFRFDVLDAQGGAMPAGASIDVKYIAFFETEKGAKQPDENFFAPNSTETYVAPISTAHPYCGVIDTINFDSAGLSAYRQGSGAEATCVYQTVENFSAVGHPDPALANRKVIIFSGWALVNGGQDKYFWSVDGQNWIEATAGYYGIAKQPHYDAAAAHGIVSVLPANGVFTNLVIDLTDYAGTHQNVYLAIRSIHKAGTPATQRMYPLVKFANCTIPA